MNTNEITTVQQDMPNKTETALFLITKAEIDSQIATAKAFPRHITEFIRKAESIATVTEDVAASCNYALPRGGKSIEGPSVRLAEIVISAYGNIRAGARVIDNDGKNITAQGICHDLENNICVTVEVKRKITDKYGKTFNDDMQTVTGNAACAIAFRNAVFKVVPAALIDPIYDKTKEVAKGKAETLITRRDKALNYARSLGVKDEQICNALAIKNVEDIDLDKLATFRGFLSAIKNGESTVKDIFEIKPESVTDIKPQDRTKDEEELSRFIDLINAADSPEKLNKLRKNLNKFPAAMDMFLQRETELETLNTGKP